MNCFKICRKNHIPENVQRKNNLKPESEKTANKISLCTILFGIPRKICVGIKRYFCCIPKSKNKSFAKTDFLYHNQINPYQQQNSKPVKIIPILDKDLVTNYEILKNTHLEENGLKNIKDEEKINLQNSDKIEILENAIINDADLMNDVKFAEETENEFQLNALSTHDWNNSIQQKVEETKDSNLRDNVKFAEETENEFDLNAESTLDWRNSQKKIEKENVSSNSNILETVIEPELNATSTQTHNSEGWKSIGNSIQKENKSKTEDDFIEEGDSGDSANNHSIERNNENNKHCFNNNIREEIKTSINTNDNKQVTNVKEDERFQSNLFKLTRSKSDWNWTSLEKYYILGKIFFDENTLSNSIEENPEVFFNEFCQFCLSHYCGFDNLPLYIKWDYLAQHYPNETAHVLFSLLSNKKYPILQYDYRFYKDMLRNRGNEKLYGNVYLDPDNKSYQKSGKWHAKSMFDCLLMNDCQVLKYVVKALITTKNPMVFSVFKLLSKNLVETGVDKTNFPFYKSYPLPNGHKYSASLWFYLAKENLLKTFYNISKDRFSERLRIDFCYTHFAPYTAQFFESIRESKDTEFTKVIFDSLYSFTDLTEELMPLFEGAFLNKDTKLYSELRDYYVSVVDLRKIKKIREKVIPKDQTILNNFTSSKML